MNADEFQDFFDFDFSFGGVQVGVVSRPFKVAYSRTTDSHVVRLKIRPDITKKDIKVRLRAGGVLEIEWPRKGQAEEVEIE